MARRAPDSSVSVEPLAAHSQFLNNVPAQKIYLYGLDM